MRLVFLLRQHWRAPSFSAAPTLAGPSFSLAPTLLWTPIFSFAPSFYHPPKILGVPMFLNAPMFFVHIFLRFYFCILFCILI
jgi:hypothetical protein